MNVRLSGGLLFEAGPLSIAFGGLRIKYCGVWLPDGLHLWWGKRGVHLFWSPGEGRRITRAREKS